ncbi:MAG TPA: class 1 fructose-bisphosphatase [Methylophilaceae bacterium]|nr:class 1 fructose-bisphosphatase [Methylophilaceae bacterium]
MTDLTYFIKELPSVKAGLGRVLADAAAACVEISRAIDRGALTGAMGNRGERNVQGEEQKKLDVISNDVFIEYMQRSGLVAGLVSEEMEAPLFLTSKLERNTAEPYLVLFDPLDGSSNVDANISVGTIFSILRCPQDISSLDDESFLQPGAQQVCAGYAMYGSSTMLVLTVGEGVQGFTLDRDTGAFVLTHPDMRIPPDTHEFAINLSNYRFWESPMQNYIDDCLQGKEGRRGRDFNMRWIASMVAEVHRILIRGGIFIYPIDSKNRKQGGRLRLLYEANPMGFIVEQAGGMASTGRHRILDIAPEALHQRIPVVMGSNNEVETLTGYYKR